MELFSVALVLDCMNVSDRIHEFDCRADAYYTHKAACVCVCACVNLLECMCMCMCTLTKLGCAYVHVYCVYHLQ